MKSVIITGAGSGIGRATALEFAQNGYFVFLVGRSLDKLAGSEKLIIQNKGQCAVFACDLLNAQQIGQVLPQIFAHPAAENLEVLVNNAGVFKPQHFSDDTIENWGGMFEGNLFSAIRITQPVFKKMSENGRGAIVNVASTLGLKPTANTGAYSAAKAAMINWTQSLALEAGPMGVRVNCVCPGIVDTPIHSFNSLTGEAKAKALASMADLQPLKRIGSDVEIAKAICFLASEDSSWTTGAVLSVDGGINLT